VESEEGVGEGGVVGGVGLIRSGRGGGVRGEQGEWKVRGETSVNLSEYNPEEKSK